MSDRARDAFEAWAVENMFSPDTEAGEERDNAFRSSRGAFVLSVRDGDTYSTRSIAAAWDGWRGGRRAALDEVAAVMAFYAEPDNYCKQPVVADTMGASVPVGCQDKMAHAKQNCAAFTDDAPTIPHTCDGDEDGPKESVVVLRECKWWGTPPVLVDGGARARTLAQDRAEGRV